MRELRIFFATILLIFICSCSFIEQKQSRPPIDGGLDKDCSSLSGVIPNSENNFLESNVFSTDKHDDVIQLFCNFLESYSDIALKIETSSKDSNIDIAYKVADQLTTNYKQMTRDQLMIECLYYQRSPFFNANINVISCEKIKSFSEYNKVDYKIEMNVVRSESSYLQKGLQTWYIAVSYSTDGSAFVAPVEYWSYEKFAAIENVQQFEREVQLANIYRLTTNEQTLPKSHSKENHQVAFLQWN